MKILKLFLIIMMIGAPIWMHAQEIKSVNVASLSEAQIQQIATEISSQGLSLQEAASMARSKGASEAQISEVLRRIQELSAAKGESIASPESNMIQDMPSERAIFSQKADLVAGPEEKEMFGFYLFNNSNLTFEPSINIQTPKQYVVGIGDEIIINVWGASEATYQFVVDKNGSIQIPRVGPIFINGTSFETAEKTIKSRLTRIYSGMAGSNPNTFANISLGGLKSMRVTLVGEVNVPGTYTLPATATLFNALYLSGGPSSNGSFRKISLIRNGKIINYIDVYQFLVNADPSGNVALQDQDVIFIPTYEKRVKVSGSFKRTGLFEMKDEETMEDLLGFLGGFTENAFHFRVQINRFTENEKKIEDVNRDQFSQYVLKNGDDVSCGNTLDRYENRISITGAVFRPGFYELKDDMTLYDLIVQAEGLLEEVYLNRGQITRVKADKTRENIPFNVAEIMSRSTNMPLVKDDEIVIKSIFDMRDEYKVGVYGLVRNSQTFPYVENMNLKDLLFKAGGFLEDADVHVVEVARRLSFTEAADITDQLVHIFTFNVPRDLMLESTDGNFQLEPYDRVYVRKLPGYREQGSVTVEGEVKYAGPFSIRNKKDRISDLVNWAGGVTSWAYLEAARFERSALGPIAIDLKSIIRNPGRRNDLLLEPGDKLIIPVQPQTVTIQGQVQNPFSITYTPGKSLSYYINSAGGWSEDPYKRRIYVTYPDGRSDRTRSFIFRNYPTVTPGSTIIVPKKPEKTRVDNTGKWMAVAGTTTSLTLAIATLVNLLNKN